MTASARQSLAKKITEITAVLALPRFLMITAQLHVHDHTASADGPACPCCGSRTAKIVETVEIAELVIDTVTGRRVRRGQVSAALWQQVADLAQHHAITFRCSRSQRHILLGDDGRHIFASGGNRSGKTTIGLVWLAIQWLRRGGPRRRFWLVASTLPKAYELLDKLFRGTGESPPILPEVLLAVRPESPRASNLVSLFVDGSVIDLRYFEGDPGAERLKSHAIIAALVDEAAHLPGPDSLTALRGRTLDARGALFFASTPRPSTFLLEVLVAPALEFERLPPEDPARVTGEHKGARWRFLPLALLDNPWLDRVTVARDIAAADPKDPSTRRDFFGEWVSNAGPLWREFDSATHVHLDENRCLKDMGRTVLELARGSTLDITPDVARSLFQSRASPHRQGMRATNLRRLLGSDVNCHPMSTVDVQVSAHPKAPADKSRWHLWVHDVIQTGHANSLRHAEKLVDLQWVRQWSPTATESPFKGCGMIVDPTAISRDPTSHKYGRDPYGLPEVWGKLGFDTRAPQYKILPGKGLVPVGNLGRYDTHLLLHNLLRQNRLHISQRAAALIKSFLLQEDNGEGIVPVKVSHTTSDILASPMDALRYLAWAIFHGGHSMIDESAGEDESE